MQTKFKLSKKDFCEATKKASIVVDGKIEFKNDYYLMETDFGVVIVGVGGLVIRKDFEMQTKDEWGPSENAVLALKQAFRYTSKLRRKILRTSALLRDPVKRKKMTERIQKYIAREKGK